MFQDHEIRSTSAESLARSASTKGSPNMRIEGPRIAKFTAKHSLAVQVIAELCAGALDERGGSMQIALFQFGPEESIGPSVCL
jgi:hypothetical protein